jgi:hypothetical protein
MKEFMYESDVGKEPLTLERVLELMGNNFTRKATYLIPDLQREYVWDSKKIINLIDTLMKGWPFGQILVANTGKMSPLFSPRTFFSKVIMFGDERGETMDAVMHADTATLVLDGQQRLQSLFLGVAPCSDWFKINVHGSGNTVPVMSITCGLDIRPHRHFLPLTLRTCLRHTKKSKMRHGWITLRRQSPRCWNGCSRALTTPMAGCGIGGRICLRF